MFIDYIILAVISAGMLIWAYRYVPGNDDPPTHDDSDGGLPVGGDSYPSSSPPSFVVRSDDVPDEAPKEDDPSSGGVPA